MAISPIAIATQGALNSPLSMAAVRGRLTALVDEEVRGGTSDPKKIAAALAKKVVDPVLRAKLLREDEEILAILLAIVEELDP